jgi:photosystem II stability/assembly factor-like uncharacterized protein
MKAHHLFVGTVGEGVFRSSDLGQSFRRVCEGGMFVECDVRALAVDPADPATLYLGSEEGVWVSRDAAENWTCSLPLSGAAVWSLHLHGSRLLAGVCPAALFRSGDGRTWHEATATLTRECPRIKYSRVTALAQALDNPRHLWAGVEIDGLHESDDDGRTWRPLGEGMTSRDIHALVCVPGAGPRLLATTNNDLNASDDGGRTWQAMHIDRVLPWKYTRALAQLAGRPEVLLLGGGDRPPGWEGAIARSADGGRTWVPARLPGRANSTVWAFAVHPADGDLVYAASVSGQVYHSEDAGQTWAKLETEFGEIRALAWAPA